MGRSKDIATSVKGDADYVNVSGDTMTGNLQSTELVANNAGNNTNIRVQNTASGSGAADGFLIQNATNNKVYLWNYESADVLFGTGGTERMKIDSSGRVTLPSQPSFYAYPSVASYNTPVSSWTTVAFNTVGWDVGSNYNGSNYRFTAPVAGKYLITWMLQLENTNEPTWIYAYPIVNGSRSVNRSKGKSFSDFKVTPGYHTENGAWIMNLAANDYVTFDIHTNGASKDLKGESHWSGILLG